MISRIDLITIYKAIAKEESLKLGMLSSYFKKFSEQL